MTVPTSLSYWPADTSQPVLELTTADLLRQAAAAAGPHTALIEVAPPGTPSLAGAEHTGHQVDLRAADLPLTGSGKIQKFRLREQIDRTELGELPPG